jgi:hypothetical protein
LSSTLVPFWVSREFPRAEADVHNGIVPETPTDDVVTPPTPPQVEVVTAPVALILRHEAAPPNPVIDRLVVVACPLIVVEASEATPDDAIAKYCVAPLTLNT